MLFDRSLQVEKGPKALLDITRIINTPDRVKFLVEQLKRDHFLPMKSRLLGIGKSEDDLTLKSIAADDPDLDMRPLQIFNRTDSPLLVALRQENVKYSNDRFVLRRVLPWCILELLEMSFDTMAFTFLESDHSEYSDSALWQAHTEAGSLKKLPIEWPNFMNSRIMIYGTVKKPKVSRHSRPRPGQEFIGLVQAIVRTLPRRQSGNELFLAQAENLRTSGTVDILLRINSAFRVAWNICRDLEMPKAFAKSLFAHWQQDLVIHLLALSVIVQTDNEEHRRLMSLRGNDAQAMIDSLDLLMDSPRATKLRKDVLLRAKITLSRRTLLCPTALQIRDKLDLDWIQSTAGGYSDVWKVLHHGEAFALKMIKFAQTNREKIEQQSLRELIVWSQLRHPCILPCLGIFNFDSAHPGFISPWMENGTLLEFVQKEGDGLSESHALSLITDAAVGVAFLHVSNIVHADLKSGNVLVRDDGRAVVADFGLSKVAATTAAWSSQQTSSTPHGTWRYWAHEVLVKGCQNTAESDVYAWGCIAYEVYTRKVIWHGYNEPEIILNMNKQRLLPRPESMGNELWQLVSCCLKHKPERRPTMSKVVERLKELLGNYQDPAAFSDTLLRTFRPKSREPSMNSTWGEIRTFMNRS